MLQLRNRVAPGEAGVAGNLAFLSWLLFGEVECEGWGQIENLAAVCDPKDFSNLLDLASSHHVIMRAFPRLIAKMVASGNSTAEGVEKALETERSRITTALSFLAPICQELGTAGDVVVIKSLDHWPDLGSDLDLYTNANPADVAAIMQRHFQTKMCAPSWGDRLASKCNFVVPGLPELVEVHIGRLGQTGEQVALTRSLVLRSAKASFGGHDFRIPAVEDQIIVGTLQRMYRHFYFRLCDIADSARLIESGVIDYGYLESFASSIGLWGGVSSYLAVVEDFVQSYCEGKVALPPAVTTAAQISGADITFKRKFIRIPLMPQAARLYGKEWMTLLRRGELENALRLTLLPGLAVAAALAAKATGSTTGIW